MYIRQYTKKVMLSLSLYIYIYIHTCIHMCAYTYIRLRSFGQLHGRVLAASGADAVCLQDRRAALVLLESSRSRALE